jgi:urease accessory protein UreH
VFSSGRPTYFNRANIIPAVQRLDRAGWMEEFDYLGSVGFFADEFSSWKEFCAALNEELNRIPNVKGAASLLSRNGCMVRFLARSASDMTFANQQLWNVGRQSLLHLPPFEHRKY